MKTFEHKSPLVLSVCGDNSRDGGWSRPKLDLKQGLDLELRQWLGQNSGERQGL